MQIEFDTVIAVIALAVSIFALVRTITRERLSSQIALLETQNAAVLSLINAKQVVLATKARLEGQLHRVTEVELVQRLRGSCEQYEETVDTIEGLVVRLKAFDIPVKFDDALAFKIHKLSAQTRVACARAAGCLADAEHLISAIDVHGAQADAR